MKAAVAAVSDRHLGAVEAPRVTLDNYHHRVVVVLARDTHNLDGVVGTGEFYFGGLLLAHITVVVYLAGVFCCSTALASTILD